MRSQSSAQAAGAGEEAVSAVIEKVRRLVARAARLSTEALDDDLPLVDQGLIDSMALIHLVTAVEECFSFTVPPDDLSPDNFGTVRRLAAYVSGRSGRCGRGGRG